MLEEQKEVAAILESEHNGWTQVAQGTTIKYSSKLPQLLKSSLIYMFIYTLYHLSNTQWK